MNSNNTKLQTLLESYWAENNQFHKEENDDSINQIVVALNPFIGKKISEKELKEEIKIFITMKNSEKEIQINSLSQDYQTNWLNEDSFEWKRWYQYRRFLLQKGRSNETINILNRTTNEILRNIGDPSTSFFKKKGLVVGYVQSGKTENFISLATKSLDVGYDLVIILAGLHNDLRSQTQIRLDKELIGKDSIELTPIGIGNAFNINVLTNKQADGDLHQSEVSHLVQLINSGEPSVIVTKKKETSLAKLNDVLTKINDKLSVLIIDDECDQASIDTAKSPLGSNRNSESHNPTIVNRMIRTAIKSVEKVSYVGYTATPNANVLIDHQTNHPIYGPDLFPDNLILLLPKNKEYIGPEELFGLEDTPALPLIRIISNEHDSEDNVESVQLEDDLEFDNLREAIASFIISGAVRAIRGHKHEHNSMLVHINRRNDDQEVLRAWVESEFKVLKNGILDSDEATISLFKELWHKDYIPTSQTIAIFDQLERWDEILGEIYEYLNKIQIMTINGDSDDALDYESYRSEGLHVIAIGGDKLSRGLTLEGLTVSYYLRSTNAYDTLMQMGRWFGYKGIYKDLCRLYISEGLAKAFVELALSNHDFYEKLKEMQATQSKPTEFGLSIMSGDTMTVTNPSKMQQATIKTILGTFSGKKPQMVNINKSHADIKSNFDATEEFIQSLDDTPDRDPENNTVFWGNVDLNKIINYLDNFITCISSEVSAPSKWAKYLKKLLESNQCKNGHVAIISVQRGSSAEIGEVPVKTSERLIQNENEFDYYISTLRSAQDIHKLQGFCDIDNLDKPILLIYPLQLKDKNGYIDSPNLPIGLSMIFADDGIPSIKEVQNTVYQQNQNT